MESRVLDPTVLETVGSITVEDGESKSELASYHGSMTLCVTTVFLAGV